MLKETLSRRLREERKKHSWTQETAAELCDLSPRFWGKIERCAASATIDTLEKISVGLGVDIEYLLKDEDPQEQRTRQNIKGDKQNVSADC